MDIEELSNCLKEIETDKERNEGREKLEALLLDLKEHIGKKDPTVGVKRSLLDITTLYVLVSTYRKLANRISKDCEDDKLVYSPYYNIINARYYSGPHEAKFLEASNFYRMFMLKNMWANVNIYNTQFLNQNSKYSFVDLAENIFDTFENNIYANDIKLRKDIFGFSKNNAHNGNVRETVMTVCGVATNLCGVLTSDIIANDKDTYSNVLIEQLDMALGKNECRDLLENIDKYDFGIDRGITFFLPYRSIVSDVDKVTEDMLKVDGETYLRVVNLEESDIAIPTSVDDLADAKNAGIRSVMPDITVYSTYNDNSFGMTLTLPVLLNSYLPIYLATLAIYKLKGEIVNDDVVAKELNIEEIDVMKAREVAFLTLLLKDYIAKLTVATGIKPKVTRDYYLLLGVDVECSKTTSEHTSIGDVFIASKVDPVESSLRASFGTKEDQKIEPEYLGKIYIHPITRQHKFAINSYKEFADMFAKQSKSNLNEFMSYRKSAESFILPVIANDYGMYKMLDACELSPIVKDEILEIEEITNTQGENTMNTQENTNTNVEVEELSAEKIAEKIEETKADIKAEQTIEVKQVKVAELVAKGEKSDEEFDMPVLSEFAKEIASIVRDGKKPTNLDEKVVESLKKIFTEKKLVEMERIIAHCEEMNREKLAVKYLTSLADYNTDFECSVERVREEGAVILGAEDKRSIGEKIKDGVDEALENPWVQAAVITAGAAAVITGGYYLGKWIKGKLDEKDEEGDEELYEVNEEGTSVHAQWAETSGCIEKISKGQAVTSFNDQGTDLIAGAVKGLFGSTRFGL